MEKSFKIKGFHCGACVKVATMKLNKIEGVQEVNIAADGQTELKANRDIPMSEISTIIEELGYSVE